MRYDLNTHHYPVIYVLHGYGGDETSLVGTVQSSLNSLIRQRKIGEMIAVFVNGRDIFLHCLFQNRGSFV